MDSRIKTVCLADGASSSAAEFSAVRRRLAPVHEGLTRQAFHRIRSSDQDLVAEEAFIFGPAETLSIIRRKSSPAGYMNASFTKQASIE